MAIDNFRELTVYKKAFALAMQIFNTSKKFPTEEKYGLTSYIDKKNYDELLKQSEEIGKLLGHMISFPEKYANQKDKK